jgi:hypothetical protein
LIYSVLSHWGSPEREPTMKSAEAARVLKIILQHNPMVPDLKPEKRRQALALAIDILSARAVDAAAARADGAEDDR